MFIIISDATKEVRPHRHRLDAAKRLRRQPCQPRQQRQQGLISSGNKLLLSSFILLIRIDQSN